jgi:hypothetical protein
MAFRQQDEQSDVPLPVIVPLTSGTTDKPDAPQSAVPESTKKVKAFGTTPQKPDYDPNFPLLSKSKGFQAAMEKSKYEPGPQESTLPKSVIMQRQLNVMENSPIFHQANADLRLRLQMAFWKQYVEPLGRLDAHPVSLQDWLKARGQKWLETHPNPKVQTSDISKLGLAGAHTLITQAAGITDIASEAATHSQWDNIKKDWFNLKNQIGAASAMMEASMAPHMGPILINTPHQDLAEVHYNPNIPGMGMNMDELYNTSKYAQHNYYRNTLHDQLLLKGGGQLVGAIPSFYAMGEAEELAGGLRAVDSEKLLSQTPEEVSALRKVYAAEKVFGRFGVVAGDVAKSSIHEAAKGYLLGSLEREGHPTREAINFALGNAVFGGGSKLLGKLYIWGDQKVTSEMLDKAVEEYQAKWPTAHSTPVAVAMAGTPGQKITRGLMEAINKETNGAFWNAPLAAKQTTLKALARKFPDLATNAGWLDEHLTELQAMHEMAQWRELMPEVDEKLKQLEKLDGNTPTSKTIAKQVAEQERADHLKNAPPGTLAKATAEQKQSENQRIVNYILKTDAERAKIKAGGTTGVPGAASAGSLEFSDNFTKHIDKRLDDLGLGKNKYVWESRGHKLLFYLNVLASETKAKGPSTERSQEAQLLMHQLMQEFPGKNLKELLAMSDTLWTKIGNLEKGGFVKPGVPTRIWRQTHLGPGESPFAHEVDLLQKAAKVEKAQRIEAAKAARAAKVEAAKTAKAEKVEKIERAPTETKEYQDAMTQYITALRKLGYTNDDISKMTPSQLVDIISKKTPKVSVKVEAPVTKPTTPVAKPMTDEEKLAAAFKKSGDAGTGKIDTGIINQVMERMFPGQKYGDLTPAEQSEVNQVAAKLSKAKGGK